MNLIILNYPNIAFLHNLFIYWSIKLSVRLYIMVNKLVFDPWEHDVIMNFTFFSCGNCQMSKHQVEGASTVCDFLWRGTADHSEYLTRTYKLCLLYGRTSSRSLHTTASPLHIHCKSLHSAKRDVRLNCVVQATCLTLELCGISSVNKCIFPMLMCTCQDWENWAQLSSYLFFLFK